MRSVMVGLLLCSLGPQTAICAAGNEAEEKKIAKWLKRGETQADAGRYEHALKAFEKADKFAAGNCFDCLLGLASSLRNEARFDQSVEAATRLVEMSSSAFRARAYNELGFSLYAKARWFGLQGRRVDWDVDQSERLVVLTAAATAFQQSIEASEGLAPAPRLNYAEALYRLGDYGAALEQLEVYLRQTPQPENTVLELREFLLGADEESSDRNAAPSSSARPRAQVVEGDIVPPVKLHAKQPQYNRLARKKKITGSTVVQAVINKRGRIASMKILKGLALGLDWDAMDAIRMWRFEPATLNGAPVDVYYDLTVNFMLR